jgi:hypothetical protein
MDKIQEDPGIYVSWILMLRSRPVLAGRSRRERRRFPRGGRGGHGENAQPKLAAAEHHLDFWNFVI